MTDDRIELSPEQKKRRRTRSVAIALVLAALVILFYAVTIAKMSVNLEGMGG
ncbi:hypothetical protein [Breoghania sp.]|uniref:hypothetical protein n=1 Tax=Breoghania sp. TaxID=2065378 RepID=UPI0026061DEB|nr:hypothetical protein [Breoghania sp.]MDJ0930266.1 hypothetical protein [Breoghania sp.]